MMQLLTDGGEVVNGAGKPAPGTALGGIAQWTPETYGGLPVLTLLPSSPVTAAPVNVPATQPPSPTASCSGCSHSLSPVAVTPTAAPVLTASITSAITADTMEPEKRNIGIFLIFLVIAYFVTRE